MAWSDYYLPAKSVRRDTPIPTGDALNFYKVNRLQLLGLVRGANRCIAALGGTPLAEPGDHDEALATSINEIVAAMFNWSAAAGFIKTGVDLEGQAYSDDMPSGSTYGDSTALMVEAAVGNLSGYWTVTPSGGWPIPTGPSTFRAVPYYDDGLNGPTNPGRSLYDCVKHAKEHVNEPMTCLDLCTRAFRFFNPTGSQGSGLTFDGDLSATGCTSAKVFVGFSPSAGYTSPVVASDNAFHLWKTVDPATLFPEQVCTGYDNQDGGARMIVEIAVDPEPPTP